MDLYCNIREHWFIAYVLILMLLSCVIDSSYAGTISFVLVAYNYWFKTNEKTCLLQKLADKRA